MDSKSDFQLRLEKRLLDKCGEIISEDEEVNWRNFRKLEEEGLNWNEFNHVYRDLIINHYRETIRRMFKLGVFTKEPPGFMISRYYLNDNLNPFESPLAYSPIYFKEERDCKEYAELRYGDWTSTLSIVHVESVEKIKFGVR